jgi:hypothetical protein
MNQIEHQIVPGREYSIEPDRFLAGHWMIMSTHPDDQAGVPRCHGVFTSKARAEKALNDAQPPKANK